MKSGLLKINFDDDMKDIPRYIPGDEYNLNPAKKEQGQQAQTTTTTQLSGQIENKTNTEKSQKDRAEALKSDEAKKVKQKISFDTLSKFVITADEIRNFNPVWLIDYFLMEQSITTIYATGGSGKSFLALILGVELLKSGQIQRFIYLDGDNGRTTLKTRRVDKIVERYKVEYIPLFKESDTGETLNRYTVLSELAETTNKDKLKGTLILIDSIRDFIKGDLGSDNVVMPFLNHLKTFRDCGATVLFLHHQPKQSKDPDENNEAYKGATAFIDSVDTAYFLANKSTSKDKADNKLILTLKPTKARNGAEPTAFIIDSEYFTATKDDYYKHALTAKERYTLDYAIQAINDSRVGINQSELAKKIKEQAKEDAVTVIGDNALWDFLRRYDEKEYHIIKGFRNASIYKPLTTTKSNNQIDATQYGAIEAVEFQE